MQKLLWMSEEYGFSSIQDCINFAKRFGWNISVDHGDGKHIHVFSGDQAVFYADNMDAVEAFLYGMGLAYSVIPDEWAEAFMKSLGFNDDDLRDWGYNKAPDTIPTE